MGRLFSARARASCCSVNFCGRLSGCRSPAGPPTVSSTLARLWTRVNSRLLSQERPRECRRTHGACCIAGGRPSIPWGPVCVQPSLYERLTYLAAERAEREGAVPCARRGLFGGPFKPLARFQYLAPLLTDSPANKLIDQNSEHPSLAPHHMGSAQDVTQGTILSRSLTLSFHSLSHSLSHSLTLWSPSKISPSTRRQTRLSLSDCYDNHLTIPIPPQMEASLLQQSSRLGLRNGRTGAESKHLSHQKSINYTTGN